jgi:pimeloyl-ACP methyl ester carboxylesterase
LNYADASVGTVNLAVIKKPGDTPDAQEVLVNPGGPGGSSVDMVMLDFESIQAKIGTKYALVGIDPRGVKNSGPQSDCFEGYPLAARNAFLATAFSPADITHEYELKKAHQSVLQYGKWCSQMYSVNGTARYAGTVATAQDMLHYIELRAKDLGKKPEEAKLWYYGISYGSVLGNTFAALFPDRVERMIIDGVLGLQDNFSGNWKGAVADGDDAARFWFRRCFEAGSLCAFNQNATSWQELEQRYLALLNELKENPVGLGDPLSQDYADLVQQGIVITPHVLTWQNVITQFFGTSYLLQPGLYTALAAGLTQLQTKNYTGLQGISLQGQIATFPAAYDDRMARTLVTCLDANRRANYTDFEDYKEFIHDIYNASSYGGLNVATFSGPICSQLDVSPPESQAFDGASKITPTYTPYDTNSSQVSPNSTVQKSQSYTLAASQIQSHPCHLRS